MKNVLKPAVTGFGFLIILYGLIYLIKNNFNLGSLLLLVIGLTVFVWFLLPEKRIIRIIKAVILAGSFVYICIAGFIFVNGVTGGADFDEDAVVVLGCGIKGTKLSSDLKARLDKALEYYEMNPEAVICVSGGQGPQEDMPEAEAMRDYLINTGMPEDHLLVETRSTSTIENFRFSKKILDDYFEGKEYKTVYITNDFHTYRAGLIAKSQGFTEIAAYPSKTNIFSVVPNYLREVLAVLYIWVFA